MAEIYQYTDDIGYSVYENNIVYGDCLDAMKSIPDRSVNLVLLDPPYNINIDYWDRINNYMVFIKNVFVHINRISKDNGIVFLFHMSFVELCNIHDVISKSTGLKHKQLIIINKGIKSVAGRCSIKLLRSFPRATEYLQFYTFEDPTGSEQLSDTYRSVNPMSKYLREEIQRSGIERIELAKLFPSKTGGMTGCVSNWVKGYNFPTENQYHKIRERLGVDYLRKEYEDLRKEYEDLRKEYEDLRYTFNLEQGITDVWDVDFYKNVRIEHKSKKPIELINRLITTCSGENDLILDPFLGSGTTGAAAINLNRRFIGIEKEYSYCMIARDRINTAIRRRHIQNIRRDHIRRTS